MILLGLTKWGALVLICRRYEHCHNYRTLFLRRRRVTLLDTMKKALLLLFFVGLVSLLPGFSQLSANAAPADSTQSLKIKWTTGKEYFLRMTMTQSTEMPMGGQPKPMEGSMEMTQQFTMSVLKENSDGGHDIEMEFGNVSMRSSGAGNEMSFDSTKPAAEDGNNPMAAMMRKIVGCRLKYVIGPDGTVQKIEGANEMIKRLSAGALSAGAPEAEGFYKQMLSDDNLKQYGSFSDTLPDHPVKIGDSWRLKKSIKILTGNLNIDAQYTLKGPEDHLLRHCQRIDFDGTLSSENGNAAATITDGKMSGQLWFDPDLGTVIDNVSNQKFTVTANSMVIKMRLKAEMSLDKVQDLNAK